MKKIIALIVSLIIVLGTVPVVNAASPLEGAKSFALGGKTTSTIAYNASKAYKVDLPEAGKFNINLYSEVYRLNLYVYDELGNSLQEKTLYANSTTGEIRFNEGIYLCAGKYYVVVKNTTYDSTATFELTLSETPVYESFKEEQGGSNNTTKNASPITRGKRYTGCIALNDNADIYKFELNQSGIMSLDLYSEMERIEAQIFDAEGNNLWNKSIYDNDTTKEIKFQEDFYLCQGTYYFSLSQNYYKGSFNFKFKFAASFESFAENQTLKNDSTATANPIKINTQYTGQFGLNDKTDVYKITISKANPTLEISGKTPRIDVVLYDTNGSRVWNRNVYENSTTKEIKFSQQMNCSAGTYYLSLYYYGGYGIYSFNINDGGKVKKLANTMGSVVNYALKTDITARINGHDIPSYNVDGYTYIVAEDLKHYGFSVVYDNDSRSLTVKRDKSKTKVTKSYTKSKVSKSQVGQRESKILLTDIVTYVNGMYTDSYNIDGKTIIRFDALQTYGSVKYSNSSRVMSVTLSWIN